MAPESAPRQPAVQTVLATPELLESILLQIPLMKILTTACRVSHHWNNVIQTSPSIQQSFFFQPKTEHVAKPMRWEDGALKTPPYDLVFIPPPVYSESFKFNPIISWTGNYDTNDKQKIPWEGCSNPYSPCYGRRQLCLIRCLYGWKEPEYLDCPRAESPDSSWRRMFLTDPPCTAVLVKLGSIFIRSHDLGPEDYGCTQVFTAWDPQGVRLGLIDELTRTAFDRGGLKLPGFGDGGMSDDAEITFAIPKNDGEGPRWQDDGEDVPRTRVSYPQPGWYRCDFP